LAQALKRPEISFETIDNIFDLNIAQDISEEVEIQIKYDGYIEREKNHVKRFKEMEGKKIPAAFRYDQVPSLSREVTEKLNKFQPISLGQASRISGVTPAAISILMIELSRQRAG
jgi:tRNA uridine 5-carboxymethylaminomethyl modification enzyme